MKLIRRFPVALLPILVVLVGAGLVVAGVQLLFGLPVALLVSGAALVTVGLLVDI